MRVLRQLNNETIGIKRDYRNLLLCSLKKLNMYVDYRKTVSVP